MILRTPAEPVSAREMLAAIKQNPEETVLRRIQCAGKYAKGLEDTYSGLADRLSALRQANQDKNNIFFVVNSGGSVAKSITQIEALFVDIDEGSQEEQLLAIQRFTLPPSIILFTGGKSLHAYWLVKDVPVEHFTALQKSLISVIGSDPVIQDLSRLMRLPGFTHWDKHGFSSGVSCVLHWAPDIRYAEAQVIESLGGKELFTPNKPSKFKGPKSREAIVLRDNPDMAHLRLLVHKHCAECKDIANAVRVRCIMPDHADEHPSAAVMLGSGAYKCQGCGVSGNLVDVARLAGLEHFAHEVMQAQLQFGTSIGGSFLREVAKIQNELVPELLAAQDLVPETREAEFIVQQIVTGFEDEMHIRGREQLSATHRRDVVGVARILGSQRRTGVDVIGAPPAFGKSTLMAIAGVELCLSDPTQGCVLVVERVADALALRDKINSYALAKSPTAGNSISFVLRSWAPDLCEQSAMTFEEHHIMCDDCSVECPYRSQHTRQKEYPILIITHERLKSLLRRGKLDRYLRWEGGVRSKLMIDERFVFYDALTIDQNTISSVAGGAASDTLWTVFKLFNNLSSGIHGEEVVKELRRLHQQYLSEHVTPEESDELNDLLWFMSTATSIAKWSGKTNWYVGTPIPFSQSLSDIHTIIFDGTASLEPYYRKSGITVVKCEHVRNFNNVVIHHCRRSFSKRRSQSTEHDKLAALALGMVENGAKCVLVIVRKADRDHYKEPLASSIEDGQVLLSHFGSLKGRNDLASADTIYLPLTHYYPPIDDMTNTAALEVYPHQLHESLVTIKRGGTYRFEDPRVEGRRGLTQAANFLQDILRCRLRDPSFDGPVNIFIMNQDILLVDKIREFLPGCKVMPWNPEILDKPRVPIAVRRLMDASKRELQNCDEVSVQMLAHSLDMDESGIRKLLGKPNTEELFLQEGLIVIKPIIRKWVIRKNAPA